MYFALVGCLVQYNPVKSTKFTQWTEKQKKGAVSCNTLQNIASEPTCAKSTPFWNTLTGDVRKFLSPVLNFSGVYAVDCNPSVRRFHKKPCIPSVFCVLCIIWREVCLQGRSQRRPVLSKSERMTWCAQSYFLGSLTPEVRVGLLHTYIEGSISMTAYSQKYTNFIY